MFTIENKLGGYINFNFKAKHKGESYLIKFCPFDIIKNNDLQVFIRSIINNDPSLLNSPKCIWNCRFILIEKFLDDAKPISFDIIDPPSEILGIN